MMVGADRIRNREAAVARDGWRLICLSRASPLMPFVAASYLLGFSSLSAFSQWYSRTHGQSAAERRADLR